MKPIDFNLPSMEEQLELGLADCHTHNDEVSAVIILLPHSHLGVMEELGGFPARSAFKAGILKRIYGVERHVMRR
jgi:hypothetical protein